MVPDGGGSFDEARLSHRHRYLWGPGPNQLLVDEAVESLTDADLNESRWALTDHLGTIRDWIDSGANLLDHAEYDSYGKRLDTPAIETSVAWTGMYRDPHTGLQRHGLDPQQYLTSVLAKIGTTPVEESDQFLPGVWKREDAAEPLPGE